MVPFLPNSQQGASQSPQQLSAVLRGHRRISEAEAALSTLIQSLRERSRSELGSSPLPTWALNPPPAPRPPRRGRPP